LGGGGNASTSASLFAAEGSGASSANDEDSTSALVATAAAPVRSVLSTLLADIIADTDLSTLMDSMISKVVPKVAAPAAALAAPPSPGGPAANSVIMSRTGSAAAGGIRVSTTASMRNSPSALNMDVVAPPAPAASAMEGGGGLIAVPMGLSALDQESIPDPHSLADVRLASAADLVEGITFAEVVAAGGDTSVLSARVASRRATRAASLAASRAASAIPGARVPEIAAAAAAAAAAGGDTGTVLEAAAAALASQVGDVVRDVEVVLDKRPPAAGAYDTGVPPARPGKGDLDVREHMDAASALGDNECRDFVARLVEGAVFAIMKEASAGVMDLCASFSSRSNSNSPGGGGRDDDVIYSNTGQEIRGAKSGIGYLSARGSAGNSAAGRAPRIDLASLREELDLGTLEPAEREKLLRGLGKQGGGRGGGGGGPRYSAGAEADDV
jgi:hypothetical protein